jgi:hypothetical protein
MDLPADGDSVYVPAHPARGPDGAEPVIELRRLAATGERVGLAFTSREALVRVLGDYQPWVSLPMIGYVTWLRVQGVVRVELDPTGEDHEWTAGDLVRASASS